MSLSTYAKKRDFKKTPEPAGRVHKGKGGFSYLIQKHAATRLHYDFRLELGGTLKSWAVPKGPSYDPSQKRLAVHVEDHPLEYGTFEGTIPKGQYGGGTVMLWDRGTWEPLDENPTKAYYAGMLKFRLHGEKLQGAWALIKIKGRDDEEGKDNWLLVKEKDEFADPDRNITEEAPNSVTTGRDLDGIATGKSNVWNSNREGHEKGEWEKSTAEKKGTGASAKGKGEPETRAKAKATNAKVAKGVTGRGVVLDARASTLTPGLNPSSLPGAKKAAMPAKLKPQLCTLVKEVPKGEEWIHEVKFDGYRIVAFAKSGKARLVTRNDNDSTASYPEVASACATLGHDVVLDGEVVVVRPDGSTDFQALQNILRARKKPPVVYYIFDIIHCDGYSLVDVPLLERKALLKELLSAQPEDNVLRYSDHVSGQGGAVYQNACNLNLEGVISKRADSTYIQKRGAFWVKAKCTKGQEFVIGGYSDPSGARNEFGALLLGYYDQEGNFIYAGKVGTGFTEASLKSVAAEMRKHAREKSPFKNSPRAKGLHWLEPKLVCEVEFTEWTSDGQLRHPSFKGLRADKPAKDVIREQPKTLATAEKESKMEESQADSKPAVAKKVAVTAAKATAKGEKALVSGVPISNPDKMLYPEGITKLDMVEYYDQIADLLLPHMVKRPVMLVRCPQGREEKCFHQKHLSDSTPAHVRGIPIREKSGKEDYLVIDDKTGLLELVNLGALEFHTWGASETDIEKPDLMVFDLDPDPGVTKAALVQGVLLVKDLMEGLGLKTFIKTTGGKGFHVVVPLQRRQGWDEVKAFSKAIADLIAKEDPEHYIATMSLAKRKGKIFIDYLRNGRGATFIAPYSTRARKNAPVATPLDWHEFGEQVEPAGWTVKDIEALLARGEIWKEINRTRQSITARMMKSVGIDTT